MKKACIISIAVLSLLVIGLGVTVGILINHEKDNSATIDGLNALQSTLLADNEQLKLELGIITEQVNDAQDRNTELESISRSLVEANDRSQETVSRIRESLDDLATGAGTAEDLVSDIIRFVAELQRTFGDETD